MRKDEVVIKAMLNKLRICERRHLADWLFDGNLRRAERLLVRLTRDGWLHRYSICAKLVTVTEPFFRFPEDGAPDCEKLSYCSAKRDAQARPEQLNVFHATKQAETTFGGFGCDNYTLWPEITHDLISSCFFAAASDEVRAGWIGEAHLRAKSQPGQKLPDAQVTERGETYALEAVHRYTAKMLHAKHEWFSKNKMPYRLL